MPAMQSLKTEASAEEPILSGPAIRGELDRVEAALRELIGRSGFAAMDGRLRLELEPLLEELESAPLPRLRALDWLDLGARQYLSLVTDASTWESYLVLLQGVFRPTAYEWLFGSRYLIPVSNEALSLETQLDRRIRYWQQQASATLAERIRQDQPAYDSVIARSLDRLQTECGLSYDALANQTLLDKKLIIGHIVHGKRPTLRTLKTYADTFATLLGRKITAAHLTGN
jgi:hypothetical protein